MAIRQYRKCCQVLEEELGVPPMEETQTLFEHILQGTLDQPPIKKALRNEGHICRHHHASDFYRIYR
jgi:DNA-binding SARP family transcriptional activator